jgi:hypothetical protein
VRDENLSNPGRVGQLQKKHKIIKEETWVTTEKMLVQGANQNSMATIDTEIAPVAKKECNTIEA